MPRALATIVRVVSLVALAGGVVVSGQPPRRLTGVVRDTSGSVLPGVTVTVTGAALIAPRTVIADEHGEYVVDALPAGRYLVTAAVRGFEPSTTEIDVGATSATRDLVVEVSSLAESVTVTVERVEVLRGPQGTLYGRNSVGGTINIVTRQPANMLETSVRLTAGNYHKLRAEGAVSGPLIKNKVMGSFAFLRGTREGFVKDLDHPDHSLGSEDTWAGRGQLRLVFGTHSELLLSGDHGQYEGVPLTYAKPLVAKIPFSIDNSSLWTVRTSDLSNREKRPAGGFGEVGCPIEPNDHADQPR